MPKLPELRFAQERIAPKCVHQIGNRSHRLASQSDGEFPYRWSLRRFWNADVGNRWRPAPKLGGHLGINAPEHFLQLRSQEGEPCDIFGLPRRVAPDPACPIFLSNQLQEEWLRGDNLGVASGIIFQQRSLVGRSGGRGWLPPSKLQVQADQLRQQISA